MRNLNDISIGALKAGVAIPDTQRLAAEEIESLKAAKKMLRELDSELEQAQNALAKANAAQNEGIKNFQAMRAKCITLEYGKDQAQAKCAEMSETIQLALRAGPTPVECINCLDEDDHNTHRPDCVWARIESLLQGNPGQALLDRLAKAEAKCAQMVGVVKWADDQMTHDHPAGENWSVRGFAETLYFKIKGILTDDNPSPMVEYLEALERVREYAVHKAECRSVWGHSFEDSTTPGQPCSCGLFETLAACPKERR